MKREDQAKMTIGQLGVIKNDLSDAFPDFDFTLSAQDMKKIEALDKNREYFRYPPMFLRKLLFDLMGLSIKR